MMRVLLVCGVLLAAACADIEVGVLDAEVCAASEVQYRQASRRFVAGTPLMRGLELRLDRCYREGLL